MTADSRRDHLLAQVLVDFARTLGGEFSIQRILDHLLESIVDILPVTGAGVMLMGDRQQLHFTAASDNKIMAIERLQNELGEGPCLEAYMYGLPVSISDLSTDTRFPRFSPRAVQEGLAAVFTFPLTLDETRLGALDLYRDTTGPLSEEDLKAAQVLTDVAAAYLYNAQARIDASAAVARLHHRSLHDPLTGLANRTLFAEALERAVARARRSHHVAAVLFIDLDGFKSINDDHGHHVGDLLLAAAARRLTSAVRPSDTLARLGGDEFAILCEDLTGTEDAETVAERVTDAMSAPFHLADHRLALSASVGIAFSGSGEDLPEVLLRDADLAMYQAKRSGGGRAHVIDPAARLVVRSRHVFETELRLAAQRDELRLLYQPIVDVGSGKLAAAEALLRWDSPDRGRVMPDEIIPSAERTGLILELGAWVLTRACQDLNTWWTQGVHVPKVAVNVSASQIMGPAFSATVKNVLDATGTDPGALCLEVTETVFLADESRAGGVLEELKALGVCLSLDDFGTGYSSPNYLRRFSFDNLKIDRSFTSTLTTDQTSRHIVQAMVGLSHAMNLNVIVEGVETVDELGYISDIGADQAQGFHFSRAITPAQLAAYTATATPTATPRATAATSKRPGVAGV